MVSPLIPSNRRMLSKSQHQGSHVFVSKSVAFHLNPSETLSKDLVKSLKDPSPTISQGSGMQVFKRTPFRMMFNLADSKGRPKRRRDRSKDENSSIKEEENLLHVTDSFQYRAEPLLEAEDFVIDVTHLKKTRGETNQVLEPERTPTQKIGAVTLVRSRPMMRRKSDMSTWSGGVAEIEKKMVFMTYEYIRQVDSEDIMINLGDMQPDNITHKGTPSTRSGKSSIKFDGSPKGFKRTPRLGMSQHKDEVILEYKRERGDKAYKSRSESRRQKSAQKEITGTAITQENVEKKEVIIKRLGTSLGTRRMLGEVKTRNYESSEDEMSKEIGNSRVRKNQEVLGEKQGNRQESIESFKSLPKPMTSSKSTIRFQDYYKPLRLTRTNRPPGNGTVNFTARDTKATAVTLSSIVNGHKRDLSTGTLATRAGQIESDVSISNNDRTILQSESKETIESKSQNLDSSDPRKVSNLLKIQEALVMKMYNHTRSISNIVGKRKSRLEANKVSTQRKENQSLSREGENKLPKINIGYGSVIASHQNALDKANKKSSYEANKKQIIFSIYTENDVLKTLRTERVATSEDKVFKFRPNVSNLKKMMKKDEKANKKQISTSHLRD